MSNVFSVENYKKYLGDVEAPEILYNVPMKDHTTFEIGGPAEVFICPNLYEQLSCLIKYCNDEAIPYFILGCGSDLLVSDKGVSGVVVDMSSVMNGMYTDNNKVIAQAGATLKDVCDLAAYSSLSGLEFACGIPGSVGGACFMNAGAYNGQISDVLESVMVVDKLGNISTIDVSELELGYRTSRIKTDGLCVLEACFNLVNKPMGEILDVMADLAERRESKQPLEWPSAGSTFKRPEGYFAGKLIMDSGMQGKSVGGAEVSTKHAGFIINKGGATASDVLGLINLVQDEVKTQYNVDLEPEVRFLGEF